MSAAHLVRRAVRWLPVLLWMAVIFCLSAQPDLPHHPEAVVDVIVKKLGHMAEYGILAALSLWALSGPSSTVPRSHFVSACALAALYAVSDELHQRFVPGRDPRPLDVGFDVAGAALALFAMSTVRRARQRPPGD
jgi:VanZ family protein